MSNQRRFCPNEGASRLPTGKVLTTPRHGATSWTSTSRGTTVGGVDVTVTGGLYDMSKTVQPLLPMPATHPGGSSNHSSKDSSDSRRREPPPLRMAPEQSHRFTSKKVEKLLKDILDAKLHNVKYDKDDCSRLAKEVCCMIKDKTKEFEFTRYKLITQVLLGQDNEQSVQVASRCLWNHETDDFAAATYRNSSLYAVAIVYGMYLD